MRVHAFHMYILYYYKVEEQGLGGHQMCTAVRGQLAELCSLSQSCELQEQIQAIEAGNKWLYPWSYYCALTKAIYIYFQIYVSVNPVLISLTKFIFSHGRRISVLIMRGEMQVLTMAVCSEI